MSSNEYPIGTDNTSEEFTYSGVRERIDELTKLVRDMDEIRRLTNYAKIRKHVINRIAELSPKPLEEDK